MWSGRPHGLLWRRRGRPPGLKGETARSRKYGRAGARALPYRYTGHTSVSPCGSTARTVTPDILGGHFLDKGPSRYTGHTPGAGFPVIFGPSRYTGHTWSNLSELV